MNLFFSQIIEGDLAVLEAEESAHLVQVLRRKPGDVIRLTDGKGTWYDGVLESAGKKNAMVRITSRHSAVSRRPYQVHLAVAPPKNIDRFEWFLEKATEIGVDRITPLWCQHSERRTLRPDRLEKILVSSMKQSAQCFLPHLDPATGFRDFIAALSNRAESRFIGYLEEATDSPHLFSVCEKGKDVLVLIGPEGDFSPEEVALCKSNGFQLISLGPNRLRTETAAVCAVQIVAVRNEAG